MQRKEMVHSLNPNGYNQLYPPSAQEEEMEENFEKEYYADFEKFAESAGFGESKKVQVVEEVIETPLAIRPEGYISDEEKEETNEPDDPNDPQNQPLSFKAKKWTADAKKRKAAQMEGESNSNINNKNITTTPATTATSATGLNSLLMYQSDSEDEE